MRRNELITQINKGFKSRILKSMVVEIFKNLDNKRNIDELYDALVILKLHTMRYYFSDEFLDKVIYGSYSVKNALMELWIDGTLSDCEYDFLYNNRDVRREMVLNTLSEVVVKRIIQFIEELC